MKEENTAKSVLQGFYEDALSQAERLRLPRAREVEGLDEEIALLRLRLLRHAKEHPENLEVLLKGVRLLVQAVVARYRLSPKAAENLSQSIAEVIDKVGITLGLGEQHGGE
ncbi:MAG: hypothetical protein HYY31_03655 [Chloroflexi bacterium]|nr:hypothetical protein [Chloroflexota bacterium]